LPSTNIKIYRTIILPVFSYGCENWSLTLREKNGLRVFENRVLKTICELKRDELQGSVQDYTTKSCMYMQSSPYIVQVSKSRMRWSGAWYVRKKSGEAR